MARQPLVRGEAFSPFFESLFFFKSLFMPRVAGDRQSAAWSQNFKPFFDAGKRAFSQGCDLFISLWQVAQIVDDEAGRMGKGKLVNFFMGHAMQNSPFLMLYQKLLCILDRSSLNIEADYRAKLCQKKGVLPIAAGGVDCEIAFFQKLFPSFLGEDQVRLHRIEV